MNEINTGGPAFPTSQYGSGVSPTGHTEGLSLRDYFAARAMQGAIAGMYARAENFYYSEFADMAYEVADAMLKAREGKHE